MGFHVKICPFIVGVILTAASVAHAGPPDLDTRGIALGDTAEQFRAKVVQLDRGFKFETWSKTLPDDTRVDSAIVATLRQPSGIKEVIQASLSPRTKRIVFIGRYSDYRETENVAIENTVSGLAQKYGAVESWGSQEKDGSGSRVWYYGKEKSEPLTRPTVSKKDVYSLCNLSVVSPIDSLNYDGNTTLPFSLPSKAGGDCGRAVSVMIYGDRGPRSGFVSKMTMQIVDFPEYYADLVLINGMAADKEAQRKNTVRSAPAAPL